MTRPCLTSIVLEDRVSPGAHDTISISSDGCDPRIQDPDQPSS